MVESARALAYLCISDTCSTFSGLLDIYFV